MEICAFIVAKSHGKARERLCSKFRINSVVIFSHAEVDFSLEHLNNLSAG